MIGVAAMEGAVPARLGIRAAPRRAAVVFVVALVLVLAVLAVILHARNGGTSITGWWYGNLTLAIALLGPAVLIARRQPANPIGWLMAAVCVSEALCAAGREYLVYGVLGGTAPGWLWIGWFTDSLYMVAVLALPITLMLVPNGRPASRGARRLLALPVAAFAVSWFGYLFSGDVGQVGRRRLENPAAHAVPGRLADLATVLGYPLTLVSMIAAVAVLVRRYRRADVETRQRVKWVVWAGSILLAELCSELIPANPVSVYTSLLASTLFAAAIAVAILRHRLFDIDLVINRTLVFAALTLVVIGGYVGIVLAAGAVLGESSRLGPGLIATGFVAAALGPVRIRLQSGLDRLMYGERRNPYRVMAQLGQRLERGDGVGELIVVVDTVTQALKLPYAAILGSAGEPLAASGEPGSETIEVPLTYQGSAMGQLIVRPRDRRGFDRDELRLLGDLARQIGAAVHAVRLSADLQASRGRLVRAKEEERRRLRRDLHDGLGPKLAALGLKVDTAQALADIRPEQSKQVLASVKEDLRQTIGDIRQLVYALRPPALDELGLVEAVRECAARFAVAADAPAIEVSAPDELPALPAAVEVAAYWIVNEALTNVIRHAGATRCDVRLAVSSDPAPVLQVTVIDDGVGLPPRWRAGVGSSSMRERAAELDGAVDLRPRPGGRGTEVSARIPCEVADDQPR